MSEHRQAGDSSAAERRAQFGREAEYTPPKSRADLVALKDRIIARFDLATGSSGAATHGPLVQAMLEEMFPVHDGTGSSVEAP